MTDPLTPCPVCGTPGRVVSGDEGTQHFAAARSVPAGPTPLTSEEEEFLSNLRRYFVPSEAWQDTPASLWAYVEHDVRRLAARSVPAGPTCGTCHHPESLHHGDGCDFVSDGLECVCAPVPAGPCPHPHQFGPDGSRLCPDHQLCLAPVGTYDGVEGGRPWCAVPCPHAAPPPEAGLREAQRPVLPKWVYTDGRVVIHAEDWDAYLAALDTPRPTPAVEYHVCGPDDNPHWHVFRVDRRGATPPFEGPSYSTREDAEAAVREYAALAPKEPDHD